MAEFPADRRLRLLVRLRGQLPDRPERRRRVDVPAPARLAQRLRRDARPPGRLVQLRARRHQVPHQRRYVPGTMVLETTWHTPTGWLVVQRRPGGGPGPETEPAGRLPARPGRHGRRGHAASPGHLHRRPGGGDGQLHAGLRVRRPSRGTMEYVGRGIRGHDRAAPSDGRPDLTLSSSSSGSGWPGPRCIGRTTLDEGECAFVALSWGATTPITPGGGPAHWTRRPVLAGLAARRPRCPITPGALHRAQRPDSEGPQLRPHRGHHGRRHHLAARDPGRRAELGLPLHLDP